MEMAIGNAPWPIGVTNAGIHARPARESIFSKQIAHVLNDETQRKYIQVGLKKPHPQHRSESHGVNLSIAGTEKADHEGAGVLPHGPVQVHRLHQAERL